MLSSYPSATTTLLHYNTSTMRLIYLTLIPSKQQIQEIAGRDPSSVRCSGSHLLNLLTLSDNKFLLKTLVNGLKDMLPRLNRCNPTQPGGETNPYPWPPPWKIKEMSFGFSAEDVNIMIK